MKKMHAPRQMAIRANTYCWSSAFHRWTGRLRENAPRYFLANRRQAGAAGAFQYLTKPVDFDVLKRELHRLSTPPIEQA
jgi:hypothetical protein